MTNSDFEGHDEVNLYTPSGLMAEEWCPICGKGNSPGSEEVCEHFIGSHVFGRQELGGPISELAFQFCQSWEALREQVQAMVDEQLDAIQSHDEDQSDSIFSQALHACPGNKEVLQMVIAEMSMGFVIDSCCGEAIKKFLDVRTVRCESDGMASDSWDSLYMDSTEPIVEMSTVLKALASHIKRGSACIGENDVKAEETM